MKKNTKKRNYEITKLGYISNNIPENHYLWKKI